MWVLDASNGIIMSVTSTRINNNTSVIRKHDDCKFVSVITLESPRNSKKTTGFCMRYALLSHSLQLLLLLLLLLQLLLSAATKIIKYRQQEEKKKPFASAHIYFRRFVDFYGCNNQLIARIHFLPNEFKYMVFATISCIQNVEEHVKETIHHSKLIRRTKKKDEMILKRKYVER